MPFFDYLQPDKPLRSVVGILNILFIIGIPIVSVILFIARLLFGTRMNKQWRLGMIGLFSINVVSLSYVSTQLARQFSSGTEITQNIDISATNPDTVNISLGDDAYEHLWFYIGDELQLTDKELVSSNICLNIKKGESSDIELKQQIYSRGLNITEAGDIARKVNVPIQVSESGIVIPSNFIIPKGEKWRNQTVELILYLPENKSVRLDASLRHRLHSVIVDDPNDFSPWHNRNEIWTMGDQGLACTSCLKDQDDAQLSFKDFTKLKIDGKMKVQINQGDEYKVNLNGRKHYTEKVEVVQMDETLLVSTELEHTSSPIRLYITMPQLTDIDTEDTDDIHIQGFKASNMNMKSKGRYEVKAYIDVDSLNLTQIDRNEVDIRGKCNYLNVYLENRAELDAEKISIREVDINAIDRSRAKLAVIDTLRQRSDERSKITVEGNPSIVIQQQ